MKRVLLYAVVGLLVASMFLGAANYAAAASTSTGDFPNRTFSIVRDSPGGPRLDKSMFTITPDRSGTWSVTAQSIAGSGVIIEVYQDDGGIETLLGSTKLRYEAQQTTGVSLSPPLNYKVYFTPYGKAGTSVFVEHFTAAFPPVASFTVTPEAPIVGSAVTFDASASTDPNNDIAGYAWDFGDGTTGGGVNVVHAFDTVGTYTVALTVTDDTLLTGTASATVEVLPIPNELPTAVFSLSRDLMTVSVNGASSSDPDGSIADFSWDWGDGNSESSGATATASHTYAVPGEYTVGLTVTDDAAGTGYVEHKVTVNTVTEDWTFSDFFNVPYGEWWDLRALYQGTGDVPVGADCFSQAGVDNYWCVPAGSLPAVASYPYTNWVNTPAGDAIVTAPYRFSVDVRNSPAMTADQPLMLPQCADLQAAAADQGVTIVCPETAPTGGSVSIDEHIGYMTSARAIALADAGCPDMYYLNDGFLTELQATITLDDVAAARLFGVTDPSAWAFGTADTSLLKSGCGSASLVDPNSGVLEQGLKAWFEAQGNGPYDVLSVNHLPFSVFSVEASGAYDAVTGEHTLVLDMTGWGFEALFARWAYWGATPYVNGLSGSAPAGWWGMEVPWLEDLDFHATLGAAAFDAQASGVIQYHLRASATTGADGLWYTADDVPMWVWQPILGDRYLPVPDHPASELKFYTGLTYTHTTPGSHRYGTSFGYDYVPAVWALKAGETQTFLFPSSSAVLYSPSASGRYDDPRSLVPMSAALVLGPTTPASGVGVYDAWANSLLVIGPIAVGSVPSTGSGSPLDGRPIYTLVQA